jgi:hypothetical protein
MRRLILVAVLILAPTSSWALVVKCPNGVTWAGSDPRNCPCCEMCRDGTWAVEGECDETALQKGVRIEGPKVLPPPTRQPADRRGVEKSPEESAYFLDFAAGLSMQVLSLLAFLAAVAMYLLPWVIAKRRKHHQADAILVLNLFLGWTVLGWIGALIWAASAVQRES